MEETKQTALNQTWLAGFWREAFWEGGSHPPALLNGRSAIYRHHVELLGHHPKFKSQSSRLSSYFDCLSAMYEGPDWTKFKSPLFGSKVRRLHKNLLNARTHLIQKFLFRSKVIRKTWNHALFLVTGDPLHRCGRQRPLAPVHVQIGLSNTPTCALALAQRASSFLYLNSK